MAISPIQLTPDMDIGTLVNAINNTFRQVEAENRTKIIKDETGVNRIIIGRRPDGGYAIQVSKPDIDVLEATPDEMIFNSDNNLFKIVDSGSVPMHMPAVLNGTQSAFITGVADHDIGYPPMVIAFMTYPSPQTTGQFTRQFGSGMVQARSVTTAGITIGYLSDETIETSETNVSFRWRVSNATGLATQAIDATIKYFLLTETAS